MKKPTQILHISAECYPAAKTGGLADVVGALPKYLNEAQVRAQVIIPKYDLLWINEQNWQEVYTGSVWMGYYDQPFRILSISQEVLGFELLSVELLGKFDRPGIYADPHGHPYGDDVDRFVSFQKAVLKWVQQLEKVPDILHCHDHHTGFIPFFTKHCPEYQSLSKIPTVFTIHNGKYHGDFGWDLRYMLPHFDNWVGGLIEWQGRINPLAAGIKSCWKLTTVSNTYLEELRTDSGGLEWLFREEAHKSMGILNGIDTVVWDPSTDPSLSFTLKKSVSNFKRENKKPIIAEYGLDPALPLISFIGRFAIEKGADVLPDLVYQTFDNNFPVNLFILGSGDPTITGALNGMQPRYAGKFNTFIGYNEDLAHQIYAGSDFLFMPSRVEPCGLNQMYALRYGTIPIVRRTGGLQDSVVDIGDEGGSGIMFNHVLTGDILHAFYRATVLFGDKKKFKQVQGNNMQLDFSWQKSASIYVSIYKELQKKIA
ncbi:MAG: glycosyltransferase [Saprospiraceae bacterium]|nr:glycosyltransferase [Saprospiraceae bacterium]